MSLPSTWGGRLVVALIATVVMSTYPELQRAGKIEEAILTVLVAIWVVLMGILWTQK